jgi:CrcB protein
MTALHWLAIALLGGAGAVARFLLDGAVQRRFATGLPLGTFTVNMLGAFVLGALNGAAVTGAAFTFAGAATLGSFTTFSAWMLESERLGEDGELAGMYGNLAVSLVVGFASATCGWPVGRAV